MDSNHQLFGSLDGFELIRVYKVWTVNQKRETIIGYFADKDLAVVVRDIEHERQIDEDGQAHTFPHMALKKGADHFLIDVVQSSDPIKIDLSDEERRTEATEVILHKLTESEKILLGVN